MLAIAERHGDDELAMMTSLGLGKSLIELGEITEGFQRFRPRHDRRRGRRCRTRAGRASSPAPWSPTRSWHSTSTVPPSGRACSTAGAATSPSSSPSAGSGMRSTRPAAAARRMGGGIDRCGARTVALPCGRLSRRLRRPLLARRARAAARRIPLRRGVLPTGGRVGVGAAARTRAAASRRREGSGRTGRDPTHRRGLRPVHPPVPDAPRSSRSRSPRGMSRRRAVPSKSCVRRAARRPPRCSQPPHRCRGASTARRRRRIGRARRRARRGRRVAGRSAPPTKARGAG